MAETTPPNGGFTQKEMLVRIDGKLDALAQRLSAAELHQAVLEERVSRVATGSDGWRDEVRAEIAEVKAQQADTTKKLAYATGTVSAVVVLANWIVPAIVRAL